MRILIRGRESEGWKAVESGAFGDEAALQNLLTDSPTLIPVQDIAEGAPPLIAAVKEFGLPGAGSADIVCFSAAGDIAIVECKLDKNPDIKRKVIGQIFEYAAYLWGMSYEELDERVRSKAGKSLADLVEEAASQEPGEWDGDEFRGAAQQALREGALMLVIAVDEINDELSRTISFLNECGKTAFSLCALEMRRFERGGTEVLVPHLHGPSTEGRASTSEVWTEDRFLDVVQKERPPEEATIIGHLYRWGKAQAEQPGGVSRVVFGRGRQLGSFSLHYKKAYGTRVSVLTVQTDGYLYLGYPALENHMGREALAEFDLSIAAIPSLRPMTGQLDKWPHIRIADAFLDQEGALESFKEAVRQLGERIRASEPPEGGSAGGA